MSPTQVQAQMAATIAALGEPITLTNPDASTQDITALLSIATAAEASQYLGTSVADSLAHPLWLLVQDGTQDPPVEGATWTRDGQALTLEKHFILRLGGTPIAVVSIADDISG